MFAGLKRILCAGVAAIMSAVALSVPSAVFAEELELIDHNADGVVDVFDYVISKRIAVAENSPASLSMNDAEGTAGSVVSIAVSIAQNTGFSTSKFIIGYDAPLQPMIPEDEESCVIQGQSAFPDMDITTFVTKKLNRVSCYTKMNEVSEEDGILFEVVFQIPEDAEAGTVYSLWYQDVTVANSDAQLPLLTKRGTITVVPPEATAPPVTTTTTAQTTTTSATTYTETVTETAPTTTAPEQTEQSETSENTTTLTTFETTTETTTTTVRTARPYLHDGIDVSQYQGDIDFEKVRDESKNKFVMMRAGFGRFASQEDLKFQTNYARATAAGLPVGAYWYSYAPTPELAKVEAHACAQVLGDRKFEYPIAFDIEEPSVLAKKPEEIGAIIEAFCSEMESMGYYVIVYCSSYYLNNRIPKEITSRYGVWVANYNVPYPAYTGDYGMWQYGLGTCPGIEGDVDVNYCYKDYEKIIKECHRNGF